MGDPQLWQKILTWFKGTRKAGPREGRESEGDAAAVWYSDEILQNEILDSVFKAMDDDEMLGKDVEWEQWVDLAMETVYGEIMEEEQQREISSDTNRVPYDIVTNINSIIFDSCPYQIVFLIVIV